MKKQPKICFACSAGGHLHELQLATKDIDCSNSYWIMYRSPHVKKFLKGKRHHYVLNTSPTNKITWIVNALQSLVFLLWERPDVIISTGAGVAFPTIWLGKKFFGCKVIFIASAADVTQPARTPYRAYPLSDLFLVQWPEMVNIFPKAKYIGTL